MVTSVRERTQGPRQWQEDVVDGIQVYAFPVPYSNAMSYRRRIVAFLEFAYRAANRAVKLRSDLVFATSTPLTIALPAVYVSRRQGIPMVFEVRDLWPQVPIAVGALKGRVPIAAARWLERFAYNNAERIVALSPGMKDGIVGKGYAAERVHIIPNSADLELFGVPGSAGFAFRRQFDWLQDRPLVVYTGSMGMINGVDYLARLAAAVWTIDPEVRFLVVGTGGQEGHVREVAENLGVLNRNFFLRKPVPRAEIPRILAAADIATSLFIDLPEMWANSANKFFDALASATPVAINYRGWQAESLLQTGAGIVLDVSGVADSAQQLVKALRNRAWLRRAGAAARRLAEERFSRDVLAQELETVLLEAAGH
jgi:glycosyltransferase involved in cell wall biosynthesis